MATFLWGPEQPLIVPTPERAFLMNDDESARCQMHQVGIPEITLVTFAKQLANKKGVFIDGGAHMGVYSILLADSFDQVFSFEAQRRTYFQLCGNIFINEKTNITPVHTALTDPANANTTKELKIVSDDGGGSTLEPTTEPIKSRETVKTSTIDSYHINNVALIKLDIEGSELKALKGAEYTLKRSEYPPIIFESNDHEWQTDSQSDLFEYLQGFGYKIGQIKPFNNMYIAMRP